MTELENVLVPFYSKSPHFCRYCHKQFPDLATAQRLHSCCKLFSCSFLPNPESIFGFGMMPQEKYCHLCDFDIECLHENASHLIQQHAETHKYRQCHQKIYYSSSDFWNHLRRFHCEGRSADFRGEQIVSSWMRVMAAVFEPADQAAGALATQLVYFEYERVSAIPPSQRYQRRTLIPQCPGDIPKASFSPTCSPPRSVPFHANSIRYIIAQSTRSTIRASN